MRSAEAPVRITEAASCSLVGSLRRLNRSLPHKPPLPNACDSEAINGRGTGALEFRRSRGHRRARGDNVIDKQQAAAVHVLNRLVHALGAFAALLTTEFALVAMPVLDESIEQGNTRQLAKWARNSLHMIKTTPPKRRRRRRHKHHRIRAGQHTSVAIGRYDLGMQGGVVEQLRQIRS